MDAWGKHSIFDIFGCPIDKIKNEELIREFVGRIVKDIDMVPMSPLSLQYCETHDPAKFGWTFVQIIQDSNITGHFVDKDGSAYLDVFSCKDYDPKVVRDLIHEYFSPKVMNMTVLLRG